MADPLVNAQYANSLFSWLPALAQRRSDQQSTLALQGLRRQQQVADQQATFEQQKNLTNLQTDRYLQVEDERTRRSNEREDSQTRRSSEREARRAYAAYATLAADAGETPKPYDSFGKNPEEAVTAISQAMSVLQGKQNDAAFSNMASSFSRRKESLKAMTVPTVDDIQGLTQQVLGKMAMDLIDTKEENWGKALAAIASGSEDVGLKFMGPQDRAAFMGMRSQGLMALRTLRTKDPAYISAAREVSAIQEALLGASFKNPKWARILGETSKESAGSGGRGAEAGLEDFLNIAGKGTPPPPPPPPPPPDATQPDPNSYGGLFGLIRRGAAPVLDGITSIPRNSFDYYKYAPGTLAQMVGGDRLVRDTGLDRADEQIQRLRRAAALPSWMQSSGDAIIRSLFRTQPQPGQAQP